MYSDLKNLFLLSWLWTLFAGFYLLAYTFWIPSLFDDLLLIIPVFILTLGLSGIFLGDGFFRIIELDKKTKMPTFPYRRAWMIIGGIVLWGYTLVYIPPEGRIVPHWPLDLAITVVAGSLMFYFARKS